MRGNPQVLHILSSSGIYGAEHVVLGLIPALKSWGIDSTLACINNPHLTDQPLYEFACGKGFDVTQIPCSGRFDPATTRSLRNLLDRHPRAIAHVHGYKSTFYALRARKGHPEIPLVSTLHGWNANTRSLKMYRLLELWMLRRIDGVCIVSEAMRTPLCNAGIAAGRITLIENGIDITRFRANVSPLPRSDFGIPSDAFVFGSVLRFSAEKNPLGLLDAFGILAQDMPRAHLLLVGDGPQRIDIEQQIRMRQLETRVHLTGVRNDTELMFPMFDCFVLPSLTEGLPLALLEAMACELPVIASEVGQVATVLSNLPADIVRAGDTHALLAAMRRAPQTKPPLAAMRKRVETHYSVTRMARDYAALYRKLENTRGIRAA